MSETLEDLKAALRVFGHSSDIPAGVKPMDYVGAIIGSFPAAHAPVIETFTPGLYSREITMFPGSIILSETHLTEHQYVILSGQAAVWTEETGLQYLSAPHFGVTHPGTQRVLFIYEECRWITFHATELTDSDEIRRTILAPFENPLLDFDPAERREKAEKEYNLLLA